jgi:regulator of protease activity HflC (stomatin/prohibitin superfamily)
MSLSDLAHFNTAARHRLAVSLLGLLLAAAGILLLALLYGDVVLPWRGGIRAPLAFAFLGASLLLAAAGFLSVALVLEGRCAMLRQPPMPAEDTPPPAGDRGASRWRAARRLVARRPSLRLPQDWLAGWPQVLVAFLLALSALILVLSASRNAARPPLDAGLQQLLGGLLILSAFPLLVIERVYANTMSEALPDAPQLERLLRLPLTAFLLFGVASVLRSLGFAWPVFIEGAMAIFIGLVALEMLLRAAAMLFVPFAPMATRRSVADSSLAALLRLTPPTLASVAQGVRRQFGIDLSRSWALAFVRQALFPITACMVVVAWATTGFTALGLNERAVYERLGEPVAVLGPGLHVHLPWPLGIMRRVELGTVHEIPVVFAAAGDQASSGRGAATDQTLPDAAAEDQPPPSADRLWDASHPSEAGYLIASETQGKQSFQIVNIDLRIVYRTGESEAAARAAAYAVAEPEALIRAQAGELLVRYFARYTLLDVLGQSRETFSNAFRAELQQGLDKLSTGLEVIAVIVEAIHPPPGAANAYHYVQAAEILSRSEVSLRRADATRRLKSAQQTAMEDRNQALAGAAEAVGQARASSVLFQGDRTAYERDGRAFLLERWLDRLGASLAKSSFIAVDHRLRGVDAPTIDLRSFGPAAASDVPATPDRASQPYNANNEDDPD